MKMDILTLSVVNYQEVWGDKAANLRKMLGYARAAARAGSDMIVFPECALTGYENEREKMRSEKMQYLLAEPADGGSVRAMLDCARENDIYVLFGFPERDGDALHNSVAVCAPDGLAGICRKLHHPLDEAELYTPGDRPFIFDSPWGNIGVTLCYDSYNVPEIYRYFAARGARLSINCTACMPEAPLPSYAVQLEAQSLTNGMYIATSDFAGVGKTPDVRYSGGSSIMGPDCDFRNVRYYAGERFYAPNAEKPGMFTATLDLTLCRAYSIMDTFTENPLTGRPDFTPERYAQWYSELAR